MKKTIKIAILGIAFLLVSIGFAGVLNYYGKIVGSVNVQGPIFYADLGANGAKEGRLLLNTKPTQTYTTTLPVMGVSFTSDILNTTFNYKPKCLFSVKVNSPSTGEIVFECMYLDLTASKYISICSNSSTFTSPGIVTGTCVSNLNSLQNVYQIILVIKPGGPGTYIETNPNGDTYLQITKA